MNWPAARPTFSPRRVPGRGPIPPDVMIVGEVPDARADFRMEPFDGAEGVGFELRKQLSEAGIVVSRCYFTYACKHKPNGWIGDVFPTSKKAGLEAGATFVDGKWADAFMLQQAADLHKEIETVQPKIVIALGEVALWMLTGETSIMNWRGSLVKCKSNPNLWVIPVIAPDTAMRMYNLRYMCVHDFKRVKDYLTNPPVPEQKILHLAPNFEQVMYFIHRASTQIAPITVDLETRARNIDCFGIGLDKTEAMCIPFFKGTGESYWTLEEETAIVLALQDMMNCSNIIGQNFQYDMQYIVRRMLVFPGVFFDTMLAQHVMFPGEPKDLGFLSSLYSAQHIYWKEDGKERDPHIGDLKFWNYNALDCVRTYEVYEAQAVMLERFKVKPQFDFLMKLFPQVVLMMLRGTKICPNRRKLAVDELLAAIEQRADFLHELVGDINFSSSPQVKDLFYNQFGLKPIKHKKTKAVTAGKEALKQIGEENPLLYPITSAVMEMRSLSTFNSNFAQAPLDADGRIRCSFNIGGTETFRFSSSESAFGTGTNLQNVPKGDRSTTLVMPNMRSMFVPDPGKIICDVDLAGADAQVVAWEADDALLKSAFRAGLKIHAVNSKDLFGGDAGADGKREPYYTYAKVGVHATNYGANARTISRALGLTIHEAEKFQKRWFSIHPGIHSWHRRVEQGVSRTRTISNRFGFRKVFFDRIENVFNQALAWVPQSTVAINVNTSLIQASALREVEFLLQVHDSLVFQIPFANHTETLRLLRKALTVVIPYQDPLTIQYGLAISEKSWGHVEKTEWPTDGKS